MRTLVDRQVRFFVRVNKWRMFLIFRFWDLYVEIWDYVCLNLKFTKGRPNHLILVFWTMCVNPKYFTRMIYTHLIARSSIDLKQSCVWTLCFKVEFIILQTLSESVSSKQKMFLSIAYNFSSNAFRNVVAGTTVITARHSTIIMRNYLSIIFHIFKSWIWHHLL